MRKSAVERCHHVGVNRLLLHWRMIDDDAGREKIRYTLARIAKNIRKESVAAAEELHLAHVLAMI